MRALFLAAVTLSVSCGGFSPVDTLNGIGNLTYHANTPCPPLLETRVACDSDEEGRVLVCERLQWKVWGRCSPSQLCIDGICQ
jgi:hypothetical protein